MGGMPWQLRLGLLALPVVLPAFAYVLPGQFITVLPLLGVLGIAVVGWEFSSLAVLGLVALIAVSPEQHVGEAGNTVLALQKAGLLAGAIALVLQRGFSGQFNGPAFAFLLAPVLTVCFGTLHPDLKPGDMLRGLLGSIAPFAMIWVRSSRPLIRWMILVAACAPLISAVAGVPLIGIGHPIFGQDQNGVVRFQGAGIPAYLAYLGEIGTYAAFAEYVLTGRTQWLALAAAAFGCIVASGTRVPMATALLFCLVVLVFARSRNFTAGLRLRLWMMGLAAAVVGVIVLGPAIAQRTFGSGAGAMGFNASGRDVIWPLFVAAIKQHPLFGQGVGTYRVLIDPDDVKYIGTMAAHNEYLRLAGDIGIVGVLLLVAGHVAWFRREWRFLLQPERVVVIAFGLAFALHSLTDNTLIAPQAVILYAWMAAFLQRARRRAEEEGRTRLRRAPIGRGG